MNMNSTGQVSISEYQILGLIQLIAPNFMCVSSITS